MIFNLFQECNMKTHNMETKITVKKIRNKNIMHKKKSMRIKLNMKI